MKKNVLFFLIFVTASCSRTCYGNCKTSQTFMFYRPLSHNVAALQQIWAQTTAAKQHLHNANFQAIFVTQKSRNSHVGNYFLIDCKHELLVAGDDSPLASQRDVRAEWLNLPSNFSGRLSVEPKQEQVGAILEFNQDLKQYTDCSYFEDWWFDIRMPLYYIKNNLQLTQTDIQNVGTTFPRDILQAFGQFPFAQIDNCNRSTFGLSEIAFAIGATVIDYDDAFMTWQVALSIPTASKQKPEHLFAPFLGANGHWGFRFNFFAQAPLTPECSCIQAAWFLIIEDFYYLKNHQLRTFDLYKKQWSRYLPFRNIHTGAVISGTELLTQHACVKPHNFLDLTTGFKFERNNLQLEIGYDLWAHHAEQLFIAGTGCDKKLPRIRDYGIAGTDGGTANNSTIAQLAANDPVPTALFENDIAACSAAGMGALTNRFHIAIAYNYERLNQSIYFGLGGYFEKPRTNTALENYAAWIKSVIDF